MENIKVILPDGSSKQLPKGSTGADLALAIGPGLAKDAVAIEINNEQKDLSALPRCKTCYWTYNRTRILLRFSTY